MSSVHHPSHSPSGTAHTATPRCPYCHAAMLPAQKSLDNNPFFPFCSERCKLADLHKWLCGEYTIEQPLSELEPDQLDDLPPAGTPPAP